MGPETTPERVCEKLAKVVTLVRQVVVDLSSGDGIIAVDKNVEANDVICELSKLTGALERCMETQKTVNELLSGKMKCTTCGATSVGLDCHSNDGSSSTATTTQRSSEERRKVSDEEEGDDEVDEKCSSVDSHRVASVDSSSSVDAFEHPIRSVSSSVSAPADEEETIVNVNTTGDAADDHDIVMKTIMNGVKMEEPEEQASTNQDSTLLDQFLQTSLLGITPDLLKAETPSAEENEEDQNSAFISNFFQAFFAGQNTNGAVDGAVSENTDSAQNSPPDANLTESLAMIESLLAESNNSELNASAEKVSRKRKSTPMKVPKTENGAGYVCPMEGCNKVFKEKGSVHRHFVTHIGMRFNCDKCKASYTQKHALMLHQKIHANPDAYQCRGCGTNYTTQNGLRLHRQRNPTCLELANAMEFNNLNGSMSKNSTPTKQTISAT
ncbi:unnamed protein product [Caenorhabditis sp. 36 PRJEB53466]|nr:unnamed protein product [Caenorhabditis sp. 36 PRJEB53466]